MLLHPQLVYPPEQLFSGVIFQPSYYSQHVLEGITIFPTSGRFHKEVIYGGINSLLLFWYPIVELVSVITISISIWFLWIISTPLLELFSDIFYISVNIIIYYIWFSLRVVVKLQIFIFVVIRPPRAVNNLINRSLCGI